MFFEVKGLDPTTFKECPSTRASAKQHKILDEQGLDPVLQSVSEGPRPHTNDAQHPTIAIVAAIRFHRDDAFFGFSSFLLGCGTAVMK